MRASALFLVLAAVATLGGAAPALSSRTLAGKPSMLVAAGDIASCRSPGDEATAKLVAHLAGTVITLGDNAYESGTAEEFTDCYDPSWGRFKQRTRPAAGNHDYKTPHASGYFAYFG